MRYRFCKGMRLAEDRVRFYGLGGYYGAHPLNVYLLRGGVQEWDEHTCKLSGEERLLRAIFAEDSPCCAVVHKSEYVPAPFVRAEIRKEPAQAQLAAIESDPKAQAIIKDAYDLHECPHCGKLCTFEELERTAGVCCAACEP